MKTLIVSIWTVLLLGCNTRAQNEDHFECTLTTEQEEYLVGEVPKLTVAIINKSAKDVYLIGSLDASEEKWRSPFCYFTMEKPVVDSLPTLPRCGNMNPLRKEDFVLVESGESFNPFVAIDGHGFFSSDKVSNPWNFRNAGRYKITFHYSTISTNIKDYLGDGVWTYRDDKKKYRELEELFENVPNVELTSNTVEIQVKDKKL